MCDTLCQTTIMCNLNNHIGLQEPFGLSSVFEYMRQAFVRYFRLRFEGYTLCLVIPTIPLEIGYRIRQSAVDLSA